MRKTTRASLEDGRSSKVQKEAPTLFCIARPHVHPTFLTMVYINNIKAMLKILFALKKLSSIKIRTQVVALLNGNQSTNVSTVISELVNLTRPGNELRLDTQELSTSLDVLVLLVTLNSELNNSAINTSADQQNIIQVASNLLEEGNSNTWLQLQKVLPFYCCM